MKIKLCCVVIFGAIILGISNGVPINSNDHEVRKLAEEASTKLFDFYDRVLKFVLNESPIPNWDAVIEIGNEIEGIRKIKFPENKSNDEGLNFIVSNVKKSLYAILEEQELFEYGLIPGVGSCRKSLSTNWHMSAYKNESKKLAYLPHVQHILETSNDPEELKYYWNAWREMESNACPSHLFLEVKEVFKRCGKDMHHILVGDKLCSDVYKAWINDFNITQMDAVMLQIEPIYRQLHGFIRHQLNKKYGDTDINAKGPIPYHLFQQVLAQTWTNGSVIDEYFPHKDLPQYDTILENNNYDSMKLLKMANMFYESMGLEKVPESYWGARLKISSCNEDYRISTFILSKTPNTVYMEICDKMDFRTFLQAHGYMAQNHFALEKPHLPAYYLRTYGLDFAVGDAVILSASSPKHLADVGIITNFEFTEEILMNRLMRLSIHTILNIPVHYVHTKLINSLFEGKIKMTEANKHYWELMDKYVGVGPPDDRMNNTFDFPYKLFDIVDENKQARKFNSEVLSYQFLKKLCSITGQYPKEKLQNCDFYGRTDAGDALKKMIKLGSSKPFREVLATMLPEDPTLNAESLLEYYSPVSSWLTEINEQNNVNMGWTHSDKKIKTVDI